ncbi:MAG: hypothetical protein DMD99_08190 [Candidatus Rokuibacteriota bacterium]|nr:MAG: hypothetical protein DMD99_08190 [Candidatus Rokubacteria bacterium]
MFSRSAYGLRTARSVCFAVVAGLTLAAFHTPLTVLVRFSFAHEHYSHILLVPLASAFLLILERKRIFSDVATGWRAGLPLVVAGPLVYAFARRPSLSAGDTDQLSIVMLATVLIVVGGFLLCYGTRAFKSGALCRAVPLSHGPDPRDPLESSDHVAAGGVGRSFLRGLPARRGSRLSDRIRSVVARGHYRGRRSVQRNSLESRHAGRELGGRTPLPPVGPVESSLVFWPPFPGSSPRTQSGS